MILYLLVFVNIFQNVYMITSTTFIISFDNVSFVVCLFFLSTFICHELSSLSTFTNVWMSFDSGWLVQFLVLRLEILFLIFKQTWMIFLCCEFNLFSSSIFEDIWCCNEFKTFSEVQTIIFLCWYKFKIFFKFKLFSGLTLRFKIFIAASSTSFKSRFWSLILMKRFWWCNKFKIFSSSNF